MKKPYLALILSLALLGGGIAWATIPDASGVIHGCYRTANPAKGALTVIDTGLGETCPSGTVGLNWNQIGPQGPAGATGSTGPQGPSGSPGISGYQVLTQHAVDIEPSSSDMFEVRGRSMGAPAGKVILSGGYDFDPGFAGNNPRLFVARSHVQGSTYLWGFVCYSPVPCSIDLFIVVADAP